MHSTTKKWDVRDTKIALKFDIKLSYQCEYVSDDVLSLGCKITIIYGCLSWIDIRILRIMCVYAIRSASPLEEVSGCCTYCSSTQATKLPMQFWLTVPHKTQYAFYPRHPCDFKMTIKTLYNPVNPVIWQPFIDLLLYDDTCQASWPGAEGSNSCANASVSIHRRVIHKGNRIKVSRIIDDWCLAFDLRSHCLGFLLGSESVCSNKHSEYYAIDDKHLWCHSSQCIVTLLTYTYNTKNKRIFCDRLGQWILSKHP